jgi:ankyrin repeat protein
MPEYQSIFEAIKSNDLKAVKDFIESGTDVNGGDWAYATPLHHAVNRGLEKIAEFLISQGADVRAADMFGLTPHKIAEAYNYASILEMLENVTRASVKPAKGGSRAKSRTSPRK